MWLDDAKTKRWTKVGIALFGAIIFILAVVGTRIVNYPMKNHDGRYDCAIILGAAVDGGRPSPVYQARLSHGIELYKNGIVSKLIFTGGVGDGDLLSEGEVGSLYARGNGVPVDDMLVERRSATTLQNLREAKKLMDENGLDSAIIVSDLFHLRRSVTMARWLQMDVGSSSAPNSRYKSWRTKFPFLLREIYFTIHFTLFRS